MASESSVSNGQLFVCRIGIFGMRVFALSLVSFFEPDRLSSGRFYESIPAEKPVLLDPPRDSFAASGQSTHVEDGMVRAYSST